MRIRRQVRARFAGGLIVCLCGVVGGLASSDPALAARVTRLSSRGVARVVNDRYLPARDTEPAPSGAGARASVVAAAATRSGGLTVPKRLVQLQRQGAITARQQRGYARAWRSALGTERRLQGTRRAELEAITVNVHDITAEHLLTASRLPVVFLTLRRNVQWWTRGPLLASGARVEFAGSQLVWEYYPGQGIELQELGSFGKADGLYSAGRRHYRRLRSLVDELVSLAVHRGGGLAWEYYFDFDGGRPPWVSAMAQGTALEALTRAYLATGRTAYLSIAHQALGILRRKPGTGVELPAAHGTRFLQYSFAPGADIINAFLQTLVGLFDYARHSGDPVAARLFAAGNSEARAEVPKFDTGAWSLYQPGVEDNLSYHELVTGFLQELCSRTRAAVYCRTARHFQTYLHTPPKITQLTARATARRPVSLRFRLSKISHVGIVLLSGGRAVEATSATFPHGVHAFSVAPLHRGTYTVRLSATDLAGNFRREIGKLTVVPGHRRPGS